jgi:hypothetical protein
LQTIWYSESIGYAAKLMWCSEKWMTGKKFGWGAVKIISYAVPSVRFSLVCIVYC